MKTTLLTVVFFELEFLKIGLMVDELTEVEAVQPVFLGIFDILTLLTKCDKFDIKRRFNLHSILHRSTERFLKLDNPFGSYD